MAGQSAFGTTTKAGAAAKRQSTQNRRTGPSNKNLGPSRASRPNPKMAIKSTAGRAIKGSDLGGGGR